MDISSKSQGYLCLQILFVSVNQALQIPSLLTKELAKEEPAQLKENHFLPLFP